MMKSVLTAFLLVLLCLAHSARGEDELGFQEWMDYEAAFGEVKVVALSERAITVEDATEKGENRLVKYYISEDAVIEGAEGLDYIYAGNMVDIEYYTTDDGRRVADFIAVEKEKEEKER
jgi:hypothetical protein